MESVKIRELRGKTLRERSRSGKPLAITNRGSLIGVMIPVTQAWVEHLIDYNWSHVRQSIAEGEQALAAGTPMLTVDDVAAQADARGYAGGQGHGTAEQLAVPLMAAVVGGTVMQPPETRETLERLRALLSPPGPAGKSADPLVHTVRIGDLSAERIERAGTDGQTLALTHDRELVGIVIPVTRGLVEFLIEQNMSRVLYNIGLGEKQLATSDKMTTLEQVLSQASSSPAADPASPAPPAKHSQKTGIPRLQGRARDDTQKLPRRRCASVRTASVSCGQLEGTRMPADASSAASYATATDNLRTATRWLLTAAAAAGAVLVAGLQLTSIGSLGTGDWPRLAAATAGLTAGLGAVGYMIFQASLLLTDEWITLAQLEMEPFRRQLQGSGRRRDKRRSEEIDRIYNELQSYQDEFYGSVADSLSDLYRRLIEANKKAREAPSPEHAQAAADLRRAVDTIVQAANYSYTRSGFAALRRHLAQAGAVFVAGIVIFAYAANPPNTASKTTSTGHSTVQGGSPSPKAAPAKTSPRQRPSPKRS